uniref:Uncharacterized protein n=1 Tax=Arundo donax TaxID=35708 RepID=A0A0A8Z3M1_ARUDO
MLSTHHSIIIYLFRGHR